MKRKSKKTPIFPKKAYSFVLWLDEAQDTILYPVRRVYQDLNSINLMMNHLHQKDAKESAYFLDFASIIPLSLEKLIPIKDEPSQKDGSLYTTWDRIHSFVQALKYPFLYNVLVVATQEEKTTEVSAVVAFAKNQTEENIQNFISRSGLALAPKVKHAAVYSVDNSFGYDVSQDKFVLEEQTFSKAVEYKKQIKV